MTVIPGGYRGQKTRHDCNFSYYVAVRQLQGTRADNRVPPKAERGLIQTPETANRECAITSPKKA